MKEDYTRKRMLWLDNDEEEYQTIKAWLQEQKDEDIKDMNDVIHRLGLFISDKDYDEVLSSNLSGAVREQLEIQLLKIDYKEVAKSVYESYLEDKRFKKAQEAI